MQRCQALQADVVLLLLLLQAGHLWTSAIAQEQTGQETAVLLQRQRTRVTSASGKKGMMLMAAPGGAEVDETSQLRGLQMGRTGMAVPMQRASTV